MIALIFAHPYPDRSRANRALLAAVRDLDGVAVRSLYERYPDFDIDVAAEQRALAEADTVVWQHPMYWYSTPGLLKHWFEKVLARGWAYGEGGTALHGKRCLWVVTTGAGPSAFRPEGMHGHPMEAFVPPVEQTARFCGMRWEEPLVVHGAHTVGDEALAAAAADYRRRLAALLAEARGGDDE
ncbi:MAG: glutathione-regulated potassium-efflux system oxidoreductase KefF [Sandaracinaceae bacterium]|nr:glutathione-regulated potassium-efflux system oxidoreductase KefF [Sandaracinaceae bacterium]